MVGSIFWCINTYQYSMNYTIKDINNIFVMVEMQYGLI